MKHFHCGPDIGDPVVIKLHGGENDGTDINGYVRAVTFTNAKVRFAIAVLTGPPPGGHTPEQLRARVEGEEEPEVDLEACFTLHNVDSCLVYAREGNPITFKFDNYS